MSGYEFDPEDKDGSLRDRFDCYCKEVIYRAAHNLAYKQAQYLILHFGRGEIIRLRCCMKMSTATCTQ